MMYEFVFSVHCDCGNKTLVTGVQKDDVQPIIPTLCRICKKPIVVDKVEKVEVNG